MKLGRFSVNCGNSKQSVGGLLVALILVVSGCEGTCTKGGSFPGDDCRQDLSLSDAQALVPFTICLPTYLPAGINTTPSVNYHADFGDPMESDIRLLYHSTDEQELALEIYQRHAARTTTPRYLAETVRSYYVERLETWAVGDRETTAQMLSIFTLDVTRYQSDSREAWAFDVISPPSLVDANLISWGVAPVNYEVFSRLPLTETKRVVASITDIADCRPEVTPIDQ